jgi:hypothetical protein
MYPNVCILGYKFTAHTGSLHVFMYLTRNQSPSILSILIYVYPDCPYTYIWTVHTPESRLSKHLYQNVHTPISRLSTPLNQIVHTPKSRRSKPPSSGLSLISNCSQPFIHPVYTRLYPDCLQRVPSLPYSSPVQW